MLVGRVYHCSLDLLNKLYVFGGKTSEGDFTIHRMMRNEWSNIPVLLKEFEPKSVLEYSQAVGVSNDTVLLFGGKFNDEWNSDGYLFTLIPSNQTAPTTDIKLELPKVSSKH